MTREAARDLNAAAVRRLFARHAAEAPPQAPWQSPTPRLADGTLPPEVHRRGHWRLGCEMAWDPSEAREAEAEGRSCLAMGERVARHAAAVGAEDRERLQGTAGAHEPTRAAKARREAIVRYEMTIPQRRVTGHYSHPTSAQADLHLTVPNAYTASRLAERRGGRWILQNPHRQLLLRGEPVMTRLMRGEFYEGTCERKQVVNHVRENKRRVAEASASNQRQSK